MQVKEELRSWTGCGEIFLRITQQEALAFPGCMFKLGRQYYQSPGLGHPAKLPSQWASWTESGATERDRVATRDAVYISMCKWPCFSLFSLPSVPAIAGSRQKPADPEGSNAPNVCLFAIYCFAEQSRKKMREVTAQHRTLVSKYKILWFPRCSLRSRNQPNFPVKGQVVNNLDSAGL